MTLGRKAEISGYLAVGIAGVDQEVLRQVDLFSQSWNSSER